MLKVIIKNRVSKLNYSGYKKIRRIEKFKVLIIAFFSVMEKLKFYEDKKRARLM